MQPTTDAKALERKIYTSFHEDGIVDLFLGLLLFVDGVLMLTGYPAFVGVAVIVLFLIPPVKKLITVPRMGIVNFSATRKGQLTKAYLLFLAAGILVFLFFILRESVSALDQFLTAHYSLIFGGIFTLLAGAGALFTGMRRYLLYVLGIPVIFIVAHHFGWPFPVALALTGLLILVAGQISLLRFLRRYPVPEIPEEAQR